MHQNRYIHEEESYLHKERNKRFSIRKNLSIKNLVSNSASDSPCVSPIRFYTHCLGNQNLK